MLQKPTGVEIQVIKYMGPDPDKDVMQHSLKEATAFLRAYFAKKI
jgi:hypothetical protein